MEQLKICIRKDMLEFTRKKRLIICFVLLALIGVLVLPTAIFMPALFDMARDAAPDLLPDSEALKTMIVNLFPNDAAGNISVLSADIAVFYSLYAVLIVQGIIPEEIKSGRWILPIGSGYERSNLIAAKAVVYGTGMAVPVFLVYNLYYFFADALLQSNYAFADSLINSLVLSFAVFAITVITILLSVIVKHSIISAVSIIMTIMVLPDLLSVFPFGQYFPTYLLTHTYMSSTDHPKLIIPVIITVVIIYALYIWSVKKSESIGVNR